MIVRNYPNCFNGMIFETFGHVERYYSFYLGANRAPINTWELDDCKLRAIDVKEALILHYFHNVYCEVKSNPWLPNKDTYIVPDRLFFKLKYRRVIEYIRVNKPHHGRTIVQFKKIKQYSQHHILEFFKK